MTRRDYTAPTFLVLFALAALLLALPSGAGAVEPTGTITGTVTLEGAGAAIGVSVCATPVIETEEEDERCTSTGAGGHYEINGLHPDEYKVFFWPEDDPGYIYQFYNDASSWSTAASITVTAGGVVPNINAVLEQGATISGVVTSLQTGLPVSQVEVCAESSGGFGCAQTNASGAYTIEGLTAGEYVVEFYPEGNGLGLLGQVYDGRSFSESPNLVRVATKEHVTGINAALQTGGAIEGTVRSAATGSPMSGVEICLTEAAQLGYPTCLLTPASGAYRFYGIPTGPWKIVFSPALSDVYQGELGQFAEEEDSPAELAAFNDSYPTQWWNGQPSFAAATPIAVTAPATVAGVDGLLGTPPTPPAVTPPASTTPPVVAKPVKPKPPAPLRCKKGAHKLKVHGHEHCVRRHVVVKHKRRKHPKHAAHRKHAA